MNIFLVMAGLVPAISIDVALLCHFKRDARHKAGHDEANGMLGPC
jgi:hypothetical protein